MSALVVRWKISIQKEHQQLISWGGEVEFIHRLQTSGIGLDRKKSGQPNPVDRRQMAVRVRHHKCPKDTRKDNDKEILENSGVGKFHSSQRVAHLKTYSNPGESDEIDST